MLGTCSASFTTPTGCPSRACSSAGNAAAKAAPRKRTEPDNWKKPLEWDRRAQRADEYHATARDGTVSFRPRVFCASLADWLDDEVPLEWLKDLLCLIAATPHLDWLLLTKRPQNFQSRIFAVADQWECSCQIAAWWERGVAPQNVWVGTTVEDQVRADERIPLLVSIPARVRFLSCEPLLGPLSFADVTNRADVVAAWGRPVLEGIQWVICGGESGPNARPMHPQWARRMRVQCAAASVPFFFKQWGEWQPYCQGRAYVDGYSDMKVIKDGEGATGWPCYRVGKTRAGRQLDGRTWDEMPACL